MRKSRFSESQVFSILKEAVDGRKVKDLCREHGIMHGLLLPVEVYVSSSRLTYTSVHCQWAGSIFNSVLYRSSYLSLAGHM